MASVRAFPAYYSPLGFQKLTVSSSSVGFTLPTQPPHVRAVLFTVESANVRMKVSGAVATTTDGLLLKDGDIVELLNTEMIKNCQLIAVSSDATVQIEYFGGGA